MFSFYHKAYIVQQIVAHVCASFATNIAFVIGDGCNTLQNVPILHVHVRK
jgi:hypothetical protein